MSGLSYFETGGSSDVDTQSTSTSPSISVKPASSKGLPSLAGNLSLGPGVLSAMEEMYLERLNKQSGFMEGMKDAAAWWSGGIEGPSAALSKRDAERRAQEENLFQLQTQIAQFKAAQEQAKKSDAALNKLFGGAAPAGAQATASGAIVGPGGIIIPPHVAANIQRIQATQGPAAAEAELNKWISTRFTEESKGRYNPSTFKPDVEVRIKGTDKSEMVSADIAGRLSDYGIYEPTFEQLDAVRSGRRPTIETSPVAPAAPAEKPAPITAAPAPAAAAPVREPAPAAPTSTELVQGNLTPEDMLIPRAAPAAKTTPVNYTFDELSPEQLAVLSAKMGEANFIRDSSQHAAAAESFNKQPLENRKKIFASLTPEPAAVSQPAPPTQVAAAPRPTTTDVTAPVAPAAAPPVQRKTLPEIQAERKVETETETTRINELKKEDSAKMKAATDAASMADDRIIKMQRVKEIVDSAPEFFGLADTPGASGAAIGLAMTGVKIGQNGQIAMPGVEDFVRKVSPALARKYPDPKVYKQKLAEVREVASYLHEVELTASQAYKGQGQVSDYERKIVAAIAGSISDPAQLLALKARWYEMKAQNDKERGELIKQMRREKGPMVAMYTIEADPRYEKMVAEQRNRARTFFSPDIISRANSIDLSRLSATGPQTSTAPSTPARQQPKFKPNTSLRDQYLR